MDIDNDSINEIIDDFNDHCTEVNDNWKNDPKISSWATAVKDDQKLTYCTF